MNPTIQSGMHPDTESLSLFAEQLLSGEEREKVLSHMAACSRCREVVFLAQQAIEAEAPAPARVEERPWGSAARRWFGGWRWAWVPVAAMAAFVGFAVIQHVRQGAPQQQVARNVEQAEAIKGVVATSENNALMQQAPKRDASTEMSAERKGAAVASSEKGANKDAGARIFDEKKHVEPKQQSSQAVDAISDNTGVAGGALHGAFAARAKSSAVGGPMAQNQMQQQNYSQQNTLGQAQAAANEVSNKPFAATAPSPAPVSGVVSESVEVQPAKKAVPSPARQMTTVPVTGQSLEVARSQVAKAKAAKVTLPSGLEALSVATAARREIAIDTAGALFLSEDGGRQWQPVRTQWTGRAVLLRTRQAGAEAAALSTDRPMEFELVNDNLQTWVSTDGKTWKEQPVPAQ